MGNSNSKHPNNQCSTTLSSSHGHSCKSQCFKRIPNASQMVHVTSLEWNPTKVFQNNLCKVLIERDLKCLCPMIMSYLTISRHSNSINTYNIYYHQNISSLYNSGKSPCPIWLNSIRPRDAYNEYSIINSNKANHIEVLYQYSDSEDDYLLYKKQQYEYEQNAKPKPKKKNSIFNKFMRQKTKTDKDNITGPDNTEENKDLSKTKSNTLGINSTKLSTLTANTRESKRYSGYRNIESSEVELLVIGGHGVGKTTLLNSYYDENYTMDINVLYRNILLNPDEAHIDSHVKYMDIIKDNDVIKNRNDKNQPFEYLDVKLREVSESNLSKYVKTGKFFILCCEAYSRRSWDKVIEFRKKILSSKKKRNSLGLMIVVTKMDKQVLPAYAHYGDELRYERLEFVKKYGIPYIELSVHHGKNIHFVFRQAIYEYWIQTQLLPLLK